MVDEVENVESYILKRIQTIPQKMNGFLRIAWDPNMPYVTIEALTQMAYSQF